MSETIRLVQHQLTIQFRRIVPYAPDRDQGCFFLQFLIVRSSSPQTKVSWCLLAFLRINHDSDYASMKRHPVTKSGCYLYGKPFYYLGNIDILLIYKISYILYKISNIIYKISKKGYKISNKGYKISDIIYQISYLIPQFRYIRSNIIY